MTSTSRDRPAATDEAGLARDRVRFLTADEVEPGHVRSPILASWRRSRELAVAADRVELPYIRDPEIDTPLTRTAAPVLRSLRDQLDGQKVSIILTDPKGLVLSRLTGDRDLEHHLDGVLLAPGFSYAEQFVGTNGIGTALEVGGPTRVFGHEHYAEDLEDLACAGVPIQHPTTGRTLGAIDLTCWRKDAGALLLALAKTTAEQIRQALLAETGAHQLELFREYLRTCRRMTGVVFALSDDGVILNDHARAVLDPVDQAALIAQAGEVGSATQRGSALVELPSGTAARMYARPVTGHGGPPGVVVHVKLDATDASRSAGPEAEERALPPGLVGSAPLWLRACREVEGLFRSGEWIAVQGEPGVGKLAILRAVASHRQPGGRLAVFDATDAETDPQWLTRVRDALHEDADNVVIRRVDRLSSPGPVREIAAGLREANTADRDHPLWVAVTLGPTAGRTPESKDLTPLLRLFPSTVEVPPLRLHLDDVPALVAVFLARLGHGAQLTCSPEAMKLLTRSTWPGNARQLLHVLRQVVKHRRSGSIQPHDLPPEARTVSRRLLSQLEFIERDAIVQSLVDARGNKAEAARSLGMSRATIYRRIRDYGIVDPTI